MADVDKGMSPELEQLVQERLAAELQALKIKFTLCFAAILFALAAASLFWGGLKSKRSKDKRSRGRSGARESPEREPPSALQTRAARHLLRNRMSTSQVILFRVNFLCSRACCFWAAHRQGEGTKFGQRSSKCCICCTI